MRLLKKIVQLLIIECFSLSNLAFAETQVNVVGLFKGKAVVMINHAKPLTLSVGQTSGEVKLIASDSQSATFEIEGKYKVLTMGQAASTETNTRKPEFSSVTLYANGGGHHLGEAIINGVSLKYVIDTGATTVTMSSGDAKYAGIDYKKGELMHASTASGISNAYRVTLNSIKLGGITLNNIEAAIIEGGFPEVVLLGNSVLSRLDMKRDGIALTLSKKY